MLKIAWGVTGSGDFMRESLDLMKEIKKTYELRIDVFLSREGEIVLRYYKYFNEVLESFEKVYTEKGPNIPFLSGKLQIGKYKALVICPATANTVAKLAYGIADSLITNSAAQAMKVEVPVYIFPVDQKEGEVVTKLPDGSDLTLRIRDIDVKNVQKLREMPGITVLESIEKAEEVVKGIVEK